MINNNVLEEFFVWEEKNLIDQNQNSLKNEKQDNSVTTIETKTDSTPKDWRDITDPKLRKKMSDKAYRESNRDKVLLKKKAYREANKDKIKLSGKVYRESNKDKINSYFKNKTKTDIQYKLGKNLRGRLGSAVKNNQKAGSAVRDLGCTIPELKQYLESKFLPGMSWDNWTIDGWHIDHIKPLSSFNLTDRQQFLEACHYTNLQPLWAKDNLLKSDMVA